MISRALLLTLLLLATDLLAIDDHQHQLGKAGTVVFPVSCSPAAKRAFPHAVALLHSFAYEDALSEFTAIARQNPNCAMAYWGEAMTWWRPLWYVPDAQALRNGSEAMAKAGKVPPHSDREQGFVTALAEFYSDKGGRDYHARAMAYRADMEKLFAKYPHDGEVGAFYALSVLATASPTDPAHKDERAAGRILEEIFSANPKHPGAAHYIIHSFDTPELAPEGLKAARAYAKIAPDVPHALHMPSHIFTRLGLWDESIRSNIDSRNSARDFAARTHMQGAWDQELHAMDYLVYAYLQQGRDEDAKKLANELAVMNDAQPTLIALYARAAIPARLAVERGDWTAAANLAESTSSPETKAITHWARALGNLRSGKLKEARQEVEILKALRKQLKGRPGYDWSTQAEIQQQEVAAWLAHAEGNDEQAVSMMRASAELEESTVKHPVTPGAVLPARELFGDLLLETHHPELALEQYELSLKAAPQRLHALHGAARAAQTAGEKEVAGKFYNEIVANCGQGIDRDEVREAMAFLGKQPN